MPPTGKPKSCGRKRACWLETQGDLINRIPLSNSETYDHNRAYELVAKVKTTKPLARCKVQCLAEGIRLKKASTFGSHPPRKLYLYKDIQRFYTFSDNPTVLIIGCSDPEKKTRNYEFLKFEERHVQTVCELINRAHSHPLCILMDGENSLIRYHSSHSSLAGDTDGAHEPGEEQVVPETSVKQETNQAISPEPAVLNGNHMESELKQPSELDLPKDSTSEGQQEVMEVVTCEMTQNEVCAQPEQTDTDQVQSRSPIPRHLRTDPVFKSLCENVNEEELWAVDMTYIDTHPQHGNQIVPDGATYLFVAHHKYPEYNRQSPGIINGATCFEDEYEYENTAELGFTTAYVHA
ncbi:hypothetical protein PHET_09843 [Paragonimus heterotremus]|uniref:Trematode PH-like domain-containing protein n=1 Tax=Paragonimus heterotremus TaxID=100268 RepID=A0A8J4T9T8_9TREM|nr:hypothetical protein PHET_09843 [Paragonimus heterotremus]